jgi:L-alanine-DL-glutamate epimerase-like enolase superfamily enzyme
MCHVVVACENMNIEKFPGDIMGPEYHEFRIAKEPLEISGAEITLTDRPGLGVDVDWALVEQNPVT